MSPTDPPGAAPAPPAADLLAALVDDSADLAAVLDGDGRIVHLNPAGRQLLELDRDPSGVLLADMCAPSVRPRLEEEILPAVRSGTVWRGALTLSATGGQLPQVRAVLRPHPAAAGHPFRVTMAARDVTAERAVAAQLAHRAFHDELTGLPHRSLFLDRLYLALARPAAETGPVSVLFLNLDRFREPNDIYGHEVGDRLLQLVAERLPAALEPGDTLARFGGDEFVVLREDLVADGEAVALAMAIGEALAAPFDIDGRELFVTASVGVAVGMPGDIRADELLRNADAAMQQTKLHGGDAFQLFDDAMRLRTRRRIEIDGGLRRALERGELTVHYQPEFSLADGGLAGAEALVRWHHPEWGLVSPAEFIPVAESTGSIIRIGAWVMTEAFRQAAHWAAERAGLPPVTVAVNLSARQFADETLHDQVAEALAASGAHPEYVCLELTESALMEDLDRTLQTLRSLKELGVGLAIDDFGTGYSSLAYLKRFPVDVLKVDQSFVRGLGRNEEDSALVGAVVAMAKALGLKTIAEGVETEYQVDELVEIGCDIAQGWYYGPAQPPADLDVRALDLRRVGS